MGSGVSAVVAEVSQVAGFGLRYLETTGAGYVEREGALTTCWNARFEDVPPVRNFPSYQGQRNFPGLYFAACMGRHVGFESWLERDQFLMLDFSPTVSSFSCQPFWDTVRLTGWGVAGAVLAMVWLRWCLGQAVVDRPTTWFQVVNRMAISLRYSSAWSK